MTVARFWRKIPQRYNLVGMKCETCGSVFFPPRAFCPHCRRDGKMVPF
ncbi:MAG: zinc ribbon domain-containing protein, partial [Methanocorpusculum sp.]|nr:zinc ribbon domain-containing protein [Methanocorpusculum sp.]